MVEKLDTCGVGRRSQATENDNAGPKRLAQRRQHDSEDQANSHRQQTVWELPDVSRVPVAKHPLFGRYFWALFTTVAGRDLITSFDLPRAESSFALTPKPVAATTTAIAPKDANIDFALIVKPPFSYGPARYHAGREIKHRTTSPLTDGAVEVI